MGKRKYISIADTALEGLGLKKRKTDFIGPLMPRNSRVTNRKRTTAKRRTFKRRKTFKKRYNKKRSYRKKFRPFSTKGFKLVDLEKYGLELGGSAPIGHSSAETFENKFVRPYLTWEDTNGEGSWTVYYETPTPGSTQAQHFGGRLSCKLDGLTTTSGIIEHFEKFKIKWVQITFKFPDQAAATTNSQWPSKLFVNYSDMWRPGWDGQYGYSLDASGSITEMLERPGWKEFDIKRRNQITIKFKPTIRKIVEAGITENASNTVDGSKMVKAPWIHWYSGQNIVHWGPTIIFQAPGIASGAPATVTDVMGVGTFFSYTTVEVKACISMKDRNQEADD